MCRIISIKLAKGKIIIKILHSWKTMCVDTKQVEIHDKSSKQGETNIPMSIFLFFKLQLFQSLTFNYMAILTKWSCFMTCSSLQIQILTIVKVDFQVVCLNELYSYKWAIPLLQMSPFQPGIHPESLTPFTLLHPVHVSLHFSE